MPSWSTTASGSRPSGGCSRRWSTRARSTSRARSRLKLYKGNVIVTGRKSPKSLYSDALVTFEDDRGAYDQKDAAGFIRLNALRLRTLAARERATKP